MVIEASLLLGAFALVLWSMRECPKAAPWPAELRLVIVPPEQSAVVAQTLPATDLPKPYELDSEVIAFCEQWADEWAQASCKARAAQHYAETPDWAVVLTRLAREDGDVR